MSLPMLVVDKNDEFHEREKSAWLKHGVPVVRVTSMQEAIELLPQKTLHFVAICADSINYIPLLRIMGDIAQIPILVGDRQFTHDKQNEAFANGAAWYAQLQDDPDKNVLSALSFLQSLHSREKLIKRTPKTVTQGNLTVYTDYHKVFCNDMEIVLTPKEYKFLHYLLSNPNITLTFARLTKKVWGSDIVSNNAVWQVVHRLCDKVNEAGWDGGTIINFRGVGYRFVAQNDT